MNGNLFSPNVSAKFSFAVKMREITNVAERILMSDWNEVESQFFGPILLLLLAIFVACHMPNTPLEVSVIVCLDKCKDWAHMTFVVAIVLP